MTGLPSDLDDQIQRALAEDLGETGDITSNAVVPAGAQCRATAISRMEGVVAGLPVFARAFELIDSSVEAELLVEDGMGVDADVPIVNVSGPARSVLAGERVALNFLQHLSGVASLTRRYVEACEGTASSVLCTRKTLPGLRALERYAVVQGGGVLHRAGLYDAVLIKDNHLRLAGNVTEAVSLARDGAPAGTKIEVEVETLDQLQEALAAEPDQILLDNMALEDVKRAVELSSGREVALEVSGGVSLDTIGGFAAAGELLISVGRITHSAPALDISLEFE
jgi:nicotinate-nucleotide pyrophosphorylase (carboxylating)